MTLQVSSPPPSLIYSAAMAVSYDSLCIRAVCSKVRQAQTRGGKHSPLLFSSALPVTHVNKGSVPLASQPQRLEPPPHPESWSVALVQLKRTH